MSSQRARPPRSSKSPQPSRYVRYSCPFEGCSRDFRSKGGMTNHFNAAHKRHPRLDWQPPRHSPPLAGSHQPAGTPPQDIATPPGTQDDAANTPEPDDNSSERSSSPTPSELEDDYPAAGCTHHSDIGRDGTCADGPLRRETHAYLNGCITDKDGNNIHPDSPPPPYTTAASEDYSPYDDRFQFEMAEFLYKRTQLGSKDVDWLMDAFAAFGYSMGKAPPFDNNSDMHKFIDATPIGDAPWYSFTAKYTGDRPEHDVPSWMDAGYDVWCRDPRTIIRNMLANPEFKDEFDVAPYREFDSNGVRQYSHLMSGDFAWSQADIIMEDPNTHGAMYVPIVLGSDKTTVSVATGQNEYYPLYISLGNVTNNVRRAHRNAVALLGFLAVPKGERKDRNDKQFRKFRRQLFHSSISTILQPLRSAMTTPEVAKCPDGHYRRVIYGLGPYIADYPEQVLAACVVQGWCPLCPKHRSKLDEPVTDEDPRRSKEHTELLLQLLDLLKLWDEYGVVGDLVPFTNDFPRADIHELLSGDLLHQVIKGTFKDHLVTWVGEYLTQEHGEAKGKEIMDEIDRRIALAPAFPGLRRFHQGRDFKQWTGDDSKALMKVYIPAIKGLVPDEMVRTFSSFLEFCYLVRRSVITATTLTQIEDALATFHQHRKIFVETGVRPDGFASLMRQHALDHYPRHIRQFGAPNGLCSSITESKHIKAVKEPWRRSNRFEALGQMLLTNQRLDKLAAARSDFEARGMLAGSLLNSIILACEQAAGEAQLRAAASGDDDAATAANSVDIGRFPVLASMETNATTPADEDDEEEAEGPRVQSSVELAKRKARRYPSTLNDVAEHINRPELSHLVARFLHDEQNPEEPLADDMEASDEYLIDPRVSVFNSAVATYYAPSDLAGVNGMHRERIRSTQSWRNGPARHDCVLVETDSSAAGMRGLSVGRVRLFFSFKHEGKSYPCALVDWFRRVGDAPDDVTGMWVVEPEFCHPSTSESPVCNVIHLDTILRNVHLLPVFGSRYIPKDISFTDTLDEFEEFYVNKYGDHHSHEIIY
ncbi:hypothetical protein BXZ70DRAFT_1069328 [Cristinia sonorae]|uniref:C2H2-type domain-containing protein n=1 Tax=Cristinia sonorae TaxID=1940300 RepID=A0A8K0UXU9_9AGAR|nr:hypothetical protein BXZ70DRAFT_1069328 [Cristinia sonorae]